MPVEPTKSCREIVRWIRRELPECVYVEEWSVNDAGALRPTGTPLAPYIDGEGAVILGMHATRGAPPTSELAIARRALEGHAPAELIAALEREGLVHQLRLTPGHRLFLDRTLHLEPLGRVREESERGG